MTGDADAHLERAEPERPQHCWQNKADRRGAGPHVAFIKLDRDKGRDGTKFSPTWRRSIRNPEIRHAACGVIYTLSVTGEQLSSF